MIKERFLFMEIDALLHDFGNKINLNSRVQVLNTAQHVVQVCIPNSNSSIFLDPSVFL
jgi:hypothetical protein